MQIKGRFPQVTTLVEIQFGVQDVFGVVGALMAQ